MDAAPQAGHNGPVRHDRQAGRGWAVAGLLAALVAVAPAPSAAESPDRVTARTTPPQEGDVVLDEVVVSLLDGRQFTGLLVSESPAVITLRIEGIEAPVDRGAIAGMERLAPVVERYLQMRAAIRDDDPDRRLDLAEWLRAREQFGLALLEVEGVLERRPQDPRARRMRTLIEQLILLRSRSGQGVQGRDEPMGRPSRPERPAFPLLTDAQVNLMKVYELDLKRPPALMVRREVIDEILERYKGHELIPLSREGRQALYRAPAVEIVELLFKLRARELYPRIQVLGQPESMRLFRDEVHRTWLANACATTKCHGGAEAGRLQLATERINADRTVFTNFLILDRFRIPDPEGKNPDGLSLIDYERPERSPLHQMGLPRDISLFPHPRLIGRDEARFRPIFRSMDDSAYRDAVDWIESLYKPRPEYPVDYTPPGSATPPPIEVQPR